MGPIYSLENDVVLMILAKQCRMHKMMLVFADRSSLRIHMKEILRGADIEYPIQSRRLKKTSAMKEAYKDLRELLQAHGKCQVLKGGVLRVTPAMLDVFL